jgi:hypothetical protein
MNRKSVWCGVLLSLLFFGNIRGESPDDIHARLSGTWVWEGLDWNTPTRWSYTFRTDGTVELTEETASELPITATDSTKRDTATFAVIQTKVGVTALRLVYQSGFLKGIEMTIPMKLQDGTLKLGKGCELREAGNSSPLQDAHCEFKDEERVFRREPDPQTSTERADFRPDAVVGVETEWRNLGLITDEHISRQRIALDRGSCVLQQEIYTHFGDKLSQSFTYTIGKDGCEKFFDYLKDTVKIGSWKSDYKEVLLDGSAWSWIVRFGNSSIKRIEGNITPPGGAEIAHRMSRLTRFKEPPQIF